ncbi:hypothetical protein CLCR_01746 [Cladophialophora carrionii]|uniref:Uncharacterized protein n=1 Tax=Cladophialophora carrionii TaxID=86049 RepID=A0A1C1CBA6_9EURO|nr:hypothetical protein CLCR_01746 [Cladophialophora carrionii]
MALEMAKIRAEMILARRPESVLFTVLSASAHVGAVSISYASKSPDAISVIVATIGLKLCPWHDRHARELGDIWWGWVMAGDQGHKERALVTFRTAMEDNLDTVEITQGRDKRFGRGGEQEDFACLFAVVVDVAAQKTEKQHVKRR